MDKNQTSLVSVLDGTSDGGDGEDEGDEKGEGFVADEQSPVTARRKLRRNRYAGSAMPPILPMFLPLRHTSVDSEDEEEGTGQNSAG